MCDASSKLRGVVPLFRDAHSVFFQDGDYHVTVRAMNNIDFGGPMALEVCHHLPLTVDTSPPIIYELAEIEYDEDENILFVKINAT